MPRINRKRALTIYLLKSEIREFDHAISNIAELDQYDFGNRVSYEAKLFVKPTFQKTPWWISFLHQGAPSLNDLFNANSAAALLLRTSGRIFAITFGYGRNLLALNAYEREFGLRVALNTINPETLRSVDARTFEELTVMTRSQTSRASGLENFRISQAQDILKAITGIPRNPDVGYRISGADAAKITYVPSLGSMNVKCDQLFAEFCSGNYRQRFGFIDQLRILSDPSKKDALNGEVIQRLTNRQVGSIHFAPPEVVDLEDIERFIIEGLNDEGAPDLDVNRYLDLMDDSVQISVSELKRRKVGALYENAAEPLYRWRLFDCIVAEIRFESKLFILSGGTWYEVEASFSDQIAHDVERRLINIDLLPEARPGEIEREYNDRVAHERGIHLLDRKMVTAQGGHSPIEFCDLMTYEKQLIHIKRRSRSSTLSHLFAQGVVSAETFLRDRGFRLALALKLQQEGLDSAASIIPEERPLPAEWPIIYGVIEGNSEAPIALPFFSQLNFKIQAERLENLGFTVSIVHIPIAR